VSILSLVGSGLNPQYADMALTLAEALRAGRLPEFVVEQEAAGLPAADRGALESVLRAAAFPNWRWFDR
jgi:hypothetical protein